jgi:hypothetical protein
MTVMAQNARLMTVVALALAKEETKPFGQEDNTIWVLNYISIYACYWISESKLLFGRCTHLVCYPPHLLWFFHLMSLDQSIRTMLSRYRIRPDGNVFVVIKCRRCSLSVSADQ